MLSLPSCSPKCTALTRSSSPTRMSCLQPPHSALKSSAGSSVCVKLRDRSMLDKLQQIAIRYSKQFQSHCMCGKFSPTYNGEGVRPQQAASCGNLHLSASLLPALWRPQHGCHASHTSTLHTNPVQMPHSCLFQPSSYVLCVFPCLV